MKFALNCTLIKNHVRLLRVVPNLEIQIMLEACIFITYLWRHFEHLSAHSTFHIWCMDSLMNNLQQCHNYAEWILSLITIYLTYLIVPVKKSTTTTTYLNFGWRNLYIIALRAFFSVKKMLCRAVFCLFVCLFVLFWCGSIDNKRRCQFWLTNLVPLLSIETIGFC